MRYFGFLPRLRIVGKTEHSIIDERILLQYIPQQIALAMIPRKYN
jgi:hypothetical protein